MFHEAYFLGVWMMITHIFAERGRSTNVCHSVLYRSATALIVTNSHSMLSVTPIRLSLEIFIECYRRVFVDHNIVC